MQTSKFQFLNSYHQPKTIVQSSEMFMLELVSLTIKN